jgi:clan AA aspartic protease
MKGEVDGAGRALLQIELRKSTESNASFIEVWVDTGFTGELVMSAKTVEKLGLDLSGSVDAILADGSQITLSTYSSFIDWFGKSQPIEIIANDGDFPLLGVGLLLGLELRIDYGTSEIEIQPSQ